MWNTTRKTRVDHNNSHGAVWPQTTREPQCDFFFFFIRPALMHKNIYVQPVIFVVIGTMWTSRLSSCSVCMKHCACVSLCILSLSKTGYCCACLAIYLVAYFAQRACVCERERKKGRVRVNCCKSTGKKQGSGTSSLLEALWRHSGFLRCGLTPDRFI